jgi:hypothetical protein
MLNTNKNIINDEGSDFAYFQSKQDLYEPLANS